MTGARRQRDATRIGALSAENRCQPAASEHPAVYNWILGSWIRSSCRGCRLQMPCVSHAALGSPLPASDSRVQQTDRQTADPGSWAWGLRPGSEIIILICVRRRVCTGRRAGPS